MSRFTKLLLVSAVAILSQGCNLTLDCNFAGCVSGCNDCSACGGCSCSTCEQCGLEPIPGGYSSTTVDNAAQIRLTQAGRTFISDHINGLAASVGSFAGMDLTRIAIPPQTGSSSGVDYSACPLIADPAGGGGQVESCYMDVNIKEFQLNPVNGTDQLEIVLGIGLTSTDVNDASGPISVDLSGLVSGTCNLVFNDLGFYYYVDVGVVPIPTGQIFEGYGTLAIGDHNFLQDPVAGTTGLDASQIDDSQCANMCAVSIGALCITHVGDVVNIANTIATSGNHTIQGTDPVSDPGIVDMLPQLLCYMVQDASYCPPGSTASDMSGGAGTLFKCIEDAGPNQGNCVPLMLGSENRIDFTKMLAGISPSTQSMVDMVLAAGGGGIADTTGYSLDMLSGANAVQNNDCVPWDQVSATVPTIPMATNFHSDVAPDGTSTHHIALGISETYGNFFMDRLWRSGTFCLSVGTSVSDLLNTSLLSLVVPGLSDLAFPQSAASLAVNVLPNLPPDFKIGDTTAGEPLITVAMNDLDVDFYVWSNERYVRFMTLNSDFVLGLNVSIDAMGDIGIDIADLAMNNPVVSNADNLTGDPSAIGPAIGSLLGSGIVSTFLPAGGIPAFSLPNLGNLTLDINMERATEGTDNFLGVFVTMGGNFTGFPLQKRADTTVEVATVNVPDTTPFAAETFGQGELPTVEIAMAGSGFDGADYEFSYRLDGLGWSEWTRSRYAAVGGQSLLMQGRHTVEVRARAVDVPGSSDLSPASAEFLVDVLPPTVEVETDGSGTHILADDLVTPAASLQYRSRTAGGSWSGWQALGGNDVTVPDLSGAPGSVDVQVRDQVGNVAGSTESLRGDPSNASSGCGGGCSTTGESLPTTGLLGLLFASMLFVRRRRQS